jgi:hypothetical protein
MKRALIAILILTIAAQGQERSLPQRTLTQTLPGTVTLSLAEYNRLLELAAHKPKVPEAAPLPFVLSRAAFKLRVENTNITGALDLNGEVLRKGPTKIPLTNGLMILDAQQSQKPLPLLQEGATHSTVVNGPGAFAISLNIAAPLTEDTGRASFTIPVSAATSSTLNLDIPGNPADVQVEPGLITNRQTANGRTIIEATLEPGKLTKVLWKTRELTTPLTQREARFLSDIKTLISVGDTELRVAALCDIKVTQGEPSEFRVALPAGFEVAEVSGSTLDSSEIQPGTLILKVREPARRAHQFLIAIEQRSQGNKVDAPFLSFAGAQGETGEMLVEGVGTMELTAKEEGGLKRIDVREAGSLSRALARHPLQGAFRYRRRTGDSPKLMLEWNQFPDTTVLSAIIDRATITTLLNAEGKSLTEVTLKVRNHAQPFIKIELPQGASLLSAEVEGEKVKPVLGQDGSRVPLLRAGFRPSGAYTVSFVYLSSGAAFTKNGSYELRIAKLDVPVNLMTWEVFLPDRLEVKQFGGNALSANLFPEQNFLASADDEYNDINTTVSATNNVDIGKLEAGQIGGIVADPAGAVVAKAVVTVVNSQTGTTQTTTSDSEGKWVISGMRAGPVRVKVDSPGFKSSQQELDFDPSRPATLGIALEVGVANEVVTITAGTNFQNVQNVQNINSNSRANMERENKRLEEQAKKAQEAQLTAPSQNVFNLQRRVSGILPVRVDVPRAGKSYKFVRPLILEEETMVSFQYRSR